MSREHDAQGLSPEVAASVATLDGIRGRLIDTSHLLAEDPPGVDQDTEVLAEEAQSFLEYITTAKADIAIGAGRLSAGQAVDRPAESDQEITELSEEVEAHDLIPRIRTFKGDLLAEVTEARAALAAGQADYASVRALVDDLRQVQAAAHSVGHLINPKPSMLEDASPEEIGSAVTSGLTIIFERPKIEGRSVIETTEEVYQLIQARKLNIRRPLEAVVIGPKRPHHINMRYFMKYRLSVLGLLAELPDAALNGQVVVDLLGNKRAWDSTRASLDRTQAPELLLKDYFRIHPHPSDPRRNAIFLEAPPQLRTSTYPPAYRHLVSVADKNTPIGIVNTPEVKAERSLYFTRAITVDNVVVPIDALDEDYRYTLAAMAKETQVGNRFFSTSDLAKIGSAFRLNLAPPSDYNTRLRFQRALLGAVRERAETLPLLNACISQKTIKQSYMLLLASPERAPEYLEEVEGGRLS